MELYYAILIGSIPGMFVWSHIVLGFLVFMVFKLKRRIDMNIIELQEKRDSLDDAALKEECEAIESYWENVETDKFVNKDDLEELVKIRKALLKQGKKHE